MAVGLVRLGLGVALFFAVLAASGSVSFVHGKCSAIGVGKLASADGTVMVAHTDDAGNDASDLRLVRVPAKDHKPGATRPVYRPQDGYPRFVDGNRSPEYAPQQGQEPSTPIGFIDQVNHTYAYWDQEYGMMNEHQLSIGESTCGSRTVAYPIDDKDHDGKALFGIEELSKIALERCRTARCAIKTMGDLACEFGFFAEPERADGGEALVIGDKEELWVFHVMPSPDGAHAIWAAQKIPDDHVVMIANDFVIQEMDLNDSDNFLYSPNMVHIAADKGWIDTLDFEEHGHFNFFKTFGFEKRHAKHENPLLGLYSGRRMWRFYSLLNAEYSAASDPYIGYTPKTSSLYPSSLQPDQKVSLKQLFGIMGDHYEGTPFDLTKGIAAGPFGNPNRFEGHSAGEPSIKGGFERPISIYRGTFSFVCQSSSDVADGLGVGWYGQDQPSGSVWVPIFAAQTTLPQSYMWAKQSEFSLDSAWWAFNFVNNWMQLGYNKMLDDISAARSELQEEAFQVHQTIVSRATEHGKDDELPILLNELSNAFADLVAKRWWSFAFKLVAKYSNGLVTTGEGPGERMALGYPDWWLKDVGYTKWPPGEPTSRVETAH